MINKYAAILKGREQEESSDVDLASNNAIFGSVGRMSSAIESHDDTHRISIYPCSGAGEAGMGLLLMLGHLLAGADNIEVYPVLFRLDDDQKISDAPFTPDEWVLDDLNDDTAIWGSLTQNDAQGWTLRVMVEDDAADGQLSTFEKTADNWCDLVNIIVDLAGEIADDLGLHRQFSYPAKLTTDVADEDVKAFSAALFAFQRDILKAALNETGLEDFPSSSQLLQAANRVGLPLTTWSAAATLGYETVLRDHLSLLGDGESYQTYPEKLAHWEDGAAIFSFTVMKNDISDPQASAALTSWCLEQLEAIATSSTNITTNWVALSIFYNKLKRPDLAIDVCQRALEADIREDIIYFAYADALAGVLEAGFKVDRLVLTPTDAPEESQVQLERVLSLELGIGNNPKSNAERLSQYVIEAAKHEKLSEVQVAFERLAENDADGKFMEIVIQQLAHLDDIDWMLNPLEKATVGGSFQQWVNLAKASLLAGHEERAKTAAENALEAAKEFAQRADAQLVLLELETPTLQSDFADILGRLQQKGGEAFESDLEFLEYVVENAPDYAEGYLALAMAYRGLDEPNTALEVLLDAEKAAKTPEIYLALAELFEQEDELTLAIENVQKGLDLAPANVPLLAQAALLAYLSDDDEASQVLLRRAHAISPYHARIVAVTRRIQDEEPDADDE